MLLAEKCGEKSDAIMRGPRVSIAPVRAPPTLVISRTRSGWIPAFLASTRASATAWIATPRIRLLTSLSVDPAPDGPA